MSYAQVGHGIAGHDIQPGTPPGDSIPVRIEPFAVEDGVPEEEEIEWAVKRLQNNRAGGPSRMRAGGLKGWLAAARRGEKEREAATKDGEGSRKDDKAGAEVEALVKADPPLIQEAWYRLQGWYKAAVDRAPPPA